MVAAIIAIKIIKKNIVNALKLRMIITTMFINYI